MTITDNTKLLYKYNNKGSTVEIYEDGTKIRYVHGNEFYQPESVDFKITNYCDRNCLYCHESCSTEGGFADIDNLFVLDGLMPGTEIALGGGDVFAHPQLYDILHEMKDKELIVNITCNQIHAAQYKKNIVELQKEKFIYGVGISMECADTTQSITPLSKIENKVTHVIAGLVSAQDIENILSNGYNVLILGYKQVGRGKEFYNQQIQDNINKLRMYVAHLMNQKKSVLSFDNLAIEQLGIKHILSAENREDLFMGEDGKFSMYVDLVDMMYAKSSAHTRYPIEERTIIELYQKMNKK